MVPHFEFTFLFSSSCLQKRYPFCPQDAQVGDTIGIYTPGNGELHISWNGIDQGPAFDNLPVDKPLYAAVSIYGRATQISIVPSSAWKGVIGGECENMESYA